MGDRATPGDGSVGEQDATGPPDATGADTAPGHPVSTVRRLRRELKGAPPTTQVRRVALQAAYDDALVDACRVAGIPDPPLAGAEGSDRPFARLLTEAALEEAGVALDPPCGGSQAA